MQRRGRARDKKSTLSGHVLRLPCARSLSLSLSLSLPSIALYPPALFPASNRSLSSRPLSRLTPLALLPPSFLPQTALCPALIPASNRSPQTRSLAYHNDAPFEPDDNARPADLLARPERRLCAPPCAPVPQTKSATPRPFRAAQTANDAPDSRPQLQHPLQRPSRCARAPRTIVSRSLSFPSFASPAIPPFKAPAWATKRAMWPRCQCGRDGP